MKIGFDARFIKQTGVGRYIQNILPLMISRSSKDQWVVLLLNEDVTYFKSLLSSKSLQRVKIIKTNVRWHSLKEQLVVPYIFYKEGVGILHVPYISVPIFYFKKLVTTVHDLTILTHKTGKASTHGYLLYSLKRVGFRLALFRALNSYKILVVSNSVKTEILQRFSWVKSSNLYVTTNGYSKLPLPKSKPEIKEVETFFKDKKISKNRPYFFYVGNLHPHKNMDKTVDFLNNYFKKHPNFSLVIAGKNDYFMTVLQQKVVSLDNNKNFHFFPNPTDGQLNLLYRCSKLVLLPSLKEGFGLQVLEAMSLNCLILCSKIPAYLEVGSSYCDYYDAKSEKSLTLALNKIIALNKSSKELRIKNYPKNLKNYSWSETAKTTLLIYKGSLGQVKKALKILPKPYK